MKFLQFNSSISAILLVLLTFSGRAQITQESLVVGERITMQSTVLNEERILNIYLPHGYSPDSSKTYPVIYLLDGSMDEDFFHISGLVQFASYSWIAMIPETIVVGISNVDRKRDFTYPTTIAQDKLDFPSTGGSQKFITYLETELRPLIDSTYATNGENSVMGQSLGGLLAAEILFKNTDLFDRYFIISPSLWWDNESLLELETNPQFADKWIYVGVGKEGKIMERDARDLYKKVSKSGIEPDRIHFEFFKEQDHGDVLHLAIYKAFEHLKPEE